MRAERNWFCESAKLQPPAAEWNAAALWAVIRYHYRRNGGSAGALKRAEYLRTGELSEQSA